MSFEGFTDGFTNRAEQALDNKGETALGLLVSSGIGQALAYCRNNPELVGSTGRVFGRWGPAALLTLGAAELTRRMVTAPDSKGASSVLGEFAFDTVLGGAVGVGSYGAAKSSAMSKFFGPAATTEVPNGVTFRLKGDTASIDGPYFQPFFQVRLANGKGFVYNGQREAIKLTSMPTKLADGTTLKYTADGMHVHRPGGLTFKQHLDGSVEYQQGGMALRQFPNGKLRTTDGAGTTTDYHGNDWNRLTPNGNRIHFNPETKATELLDKSQWRTSWSGDNFTGMRSALGRHEVVQAENGLLYKFTHGTDRWLRRNGPARVDEMPIQIHSGQTHLGLHRGTSIDLRRPIIEPPPVFDPKVQPVL